MDFSWSEMLVVGIVALIFIGPKDLPGMFRELGRFTAKIRAMGRDFNRAMETAAKESGVKDVADDLRKMTNPKALGLDAMKSAADKFDKWDPLKPATPKPAPVTAPGLGTAATAVAPIPAVATPGPATAALSSAVQAKKAAAAERGAALAAVKSAPKAATAPTGATPVAAAPAETAVAAPAVKRGGRTRKAAALAQPAPMPGGDAT